ncbi:MAG TPA: ABC transporter ATP-binding protein [Chloroflexota bacterium]|nr:ABC transporter ATP-binding protein [Chloroflexota bacterium]
MRAALLSVRNLRTVFRLRDTVVRAVNGVSYDLAPGEALGIVGESGSGKSVSSLSLMRLLPEPPAEVRADAVLFDGVDLMALRPEAMARVRGRDLAMIFQDPMTSLNPVLTVGLQIEEALQEHLGYGRRRATERALELLEQVGIPAARERLRQYPHQFSGGMRQRAMIAMAIACGPKLLIADEPTTALDVTIQAQILDLLRRLRRELGMALILITHDLGVVAGMCDRVAVMYAGYIVEQAPTRRLFAQPSHPYTLGLLRSVPRLDGDPDADLASIEGAPPDLAALGPGCPFAPRCPFAMDKCAAEMPPLDEIEGDHSIRCWVDVNTGRERVRAIPSPVGRGVG